jgi:CRISPR-associated protein Cmr4
MNRLSILRTLTNLHVGTGQSVSTIDLPIARERATNWPVVPGSSIKRVLRDAARTDWLEQQGKARNEVSEADEAIKTMFGSTKQGSPEAGNLIVSDQRIVLFPVRSFNGVFAYATCAAALERVRELACACGLILPSTSPLERKQSDPPRCITLDVSVNRLDNDRKILLEDIDLEADKPHPNEVTTLTAYIKVLSAGSGIPVEALEKRLVILDGTTFTYLSETATDTMTHVTLNYETRTAEGGMLRMEESVPPDAVFAGILMIQRGFLDTSKTGRYLDSLNDTYIQIGGKSSTGSGVTRFGVVNP